MKKIIAWILLSSKNANNVSLTIKGILLSAVTYVVFFAGVFHLNLQATDLNNLIEAITKFIEWGLTGVSIISTAWGLIRKIITTIKGDNEVLNQY